MFKYLLLICLFILPAISFADQPSSSATASEHYVFMEKQAVVIACWFAVILGAICGYAIGSRKTGQ